MKCCPNLNIIILALISLMIMVDLWHTSTTLYTASGFFLIILVLLIASLTLADLPRKFKHYLSLTLISGGIGVAVVLGGVLFASIFVIWVIVAIMTFCEPD